MQSIPFPNRLIFILENLSSPDIWTPLLWVMVKGREGYLSLALRSLLCTRPPCQADPCHCVNGLLCPQASTGASPPRGAGRTLEEGSEDVCLFPDALLVGLPWPTVPGKGLSPFSRGNGSPVSYCRLTGSLNSARSFLHSSLPRLSSGDPV